jgi:serine/threonine protein kinase
VWKLADFGFTSEATSASLHTSTSSRGTPGYRAPELLSDHKPVYNNKVDIWSMGCILYELAQGQKAFYTDWATIQHKTSGSSLDIILDETFSEQCKEAVTVSIHAMLQIDSVLRPSAKYLFNEFSQNFESTQVQPCNNVRIDRDFTEKRIFQIDSASSNNRVIGLPLVFECASDKEHSICMFQDAIEKEPLNYWLWHDLCRLYAAMNDLDGAIQACELGIKKYSAYPSPLMELTNLYAANGDYKGAIMIGSQLLKFKPVILLLALKDSTDPLITPTSSKSKWESSLEP